MEIKEISTPRLVKSVAHALEILGIINDSPTGCTIKKIAEQLNLSHVAVYHLLRTLEFYNYIRQDRSSKLYHLSTSAMNLSIGMKYEVALTRICLPGMYDLNYQSGEQILLSTWYEDDVETILSLPSTKQFILNPHNRGNLPRRFQFHCSATGKILVSHKTDSEINLMIEKYGLYPHTPFTVTNIDEFKSEISRIRKQGYATTYQEYTLGKAAIAMTTHDYSGNAVAAISIGVPSDSFTKEYELILKNKLEVCVRSISQRLGYEQ